MNPDAPAGQLYRVAMMANGSQDWNLSEDDRNALRFVLAELQRLKRAKAELLNCLSGISRQTAAMVEGNS